MKKLLQFSSLAIALSLGMYTNAQIVDGGFEGGTPSSSWAEASTNFGTPLCDAGCGTCGGPCVANNGSFYAWFGGFGGGTETASVQQSVFFPTGTTAFLTLFVKIAGPGAGLANDRLEVRVDGNVVSTITAQDSADYENYTQLSINVASYANGNNHTVRIEGFQTTTAVFNILVDDVILYVNGQAVELFEEIMEPTFKVFPNPATDAINLTFGEVYGDATVSIISADGTIVSKEDVSDIFNKNFVFNTENLENGVYIVEVTNEGTTTTKRVVVAK